MNSDQVPWVRQGESTPSLHSSFPSATEREAPVFSTLKGKALSGKKQGKSPGAEFSGDLKTHLGCLAILHFFHFDLHYGVVRCGFRYLWFPPPPSSKQKSSTSKDGERCDRQIHRSVQVTVEKMSSHKDPRCQNSNKALSSLISGLSVTYELSIHLWPRKHGIWRCHHLQMKAQTFLVPVLFIGYLGIVCF